MSAMRPEIVAEATVEARRFLARVKPRTLRTDKGRVITTAELAESLVKRADLEHAFVKGARPKTILCAECKKVVMVARIGPVPRRCKTCTQPHREAVEEPGLSLDVVAERARELAASKGLGAAWAEKVVSAMAGEEDAPAGS